MSEQQLARLMQAASAAQAGGQGDAARRHLEQALAIAPAHPGALNALGLQLLAAGDAAAAAERFAQAAAADPGAPPLWLNLAKAERLRGSDEGERRALQRALDIDQRDLTALIRMAELHQRLGEEAKAHHRWSAVIAVGQYVDQPSAELTAILARARSYVAERNRLFGDTVEAGLRDGRGALSPLERRRFDTCVDATLGVRRIYANECAGLHYPFLPADEYFDRAHFPWLADFERHTDAIAAELRALLDDGDRGFRPYVSQQSGTPENKWTELDNSLRWGAFFLWEFGARQDEACERCPATVEALAAVPLCELPGRAPNVFFSLLRPKTRIPPHTGVTNARTIIHLPLIVPGNCRFRVGGETREWQLGEALAFDDTIEHEAWNDSDHLRAVLIVDVWNPHIHESERAMIRRFFEVSDESEHNPGIGFQ